MIAKLWAAVFGGLLLCAIAPAQPAKPKFVVIDLSQPGKLLVTDADGKRFGFDPVSRQTLNEIAGATTAQTPDRRPPTYRVPVADLQKPIKIEVFGASENDTADLSVTAAGSIIRVINLRLAPNQIYSFSLAPGGGRLEFAHKLRAETPTFRFAFDPPDGKQPSYILQLDRTGAPLGAGKKITINLDYRQQQIVFADDDRAKTSVYAVNLKRINPDGTENVFARERIAASRKNNFMLDFKNWNGGESGVCLRIDERGGEFKNAVCQK